MELIFCKKCYGMQTICEWNSYVSEWHSLKESGLCIGLKFKKVKVVCEKLLHYELAS
ncbi:hypothetical protein HanXRQr2_Chr10g0443981 [Helianthus annuus]|uniref:Uncharacterized protein n=1 Tax=Helianthus annuus TaxID=4232 RepID=A0A251TJ47_HELAN|nr:hypothetical protein HanXRQr2_Chr10g0443981 [Helianthus annuus]